jgi:hypothetical protein
MTSESTSYTLERTGQRPLRFTGELLAEAGTSMNNAASDYSGTTGICHTAKVFRTTAGKYVVGLVTHTAWQGHRDSHQAEVFDTLAELADWLVGSAPARITDELLPALPDEEVAEDVA